MISRVLVVDDDDAVRTVLRTFLTRIGYEVSEAESGPLALAQLHGFRPHMILLDIHMPGMDGIEVLKAIRALNSDATIIMVTGENDAEVGRRAIEFGANDYITKPFAFEQLETNITGHLLLRDDD